MACLGRCSKGACWRATGGCTRQRWNGWRLLNSASTNPSLPAGLSTCNDSNVKHAEVWSNMNTDDLARQLHDKATRGGTLTAEEQACLEQWYAHLDQEEMAQLARAHAPQTVAGLQ